MIKEVAYSAALAGFLCRAFNHGHEVRITIQVDGEQCGVEILASAREPLVEYLSQWSCSQKLIKQVRLDEFYRNGRGVASVSMGVDNQQAVNQGPGSKIRGDFNAEGGG